MPPPSHFKRLKRETFEKSNYSVRRTFPTSQPPEFVPATAPSTPVCHEKGRILIALRSRIKVIHYFLFLCLAPMF